MFDAFGIPAGDRPMWFKVNFWSGWSAAGILLYLLLRCSDARIADSKTSREAEDKIRKEAETAAQVRVDKELSRLMQAIDFNRRSLDTANNKLDTIKSSI